MKFYRLIRKTCPFRIWMKNVKHLLAILDDTYPNQEHGLNLAKCGFIKTEVYNAHECILVVECGKILGFVFLMTKHVSALYITLMASCSKGVGSSLINLLNSCHAYNHKYLCLRATISSVGFYIKFGFEIFNFLTLDTYMNGRIYENVTKQVQTILGDICALKLLQKEIVDQNLIHQNSDEFPLLKKRNICSCVSENRRSRRLNT
jgi:hypothetical protein